MLELLKAKSLFVIAALLVTIVGLLLHQQDMSQRFEQRQAALEAREKQRWEQMQKDAETQQFFPGNFEQGMKNRKLY